MNSGSLDSKNRYVNAFDKASPYEVAESTRPHIWYPMLLIWLVWSPHESLRDYGWVTIVLVVFVFAFAMTMVLHYWIHRSSHLRSIHELEKDLPWFGAEPVTVASLPPAEHLADALAKRGYESIELDGTRITSWQDLAEVMQEQVGSMTFPADPRQKVRALMTYLASEQPRKRALIWRDASTAADQKPALVTSFASTWSAYALSLPPGLLVFVDLPQHAEPNAPAEEPTLHRSDATSDPDRSILADAPDGAWWKPRPGELTH